MTAPHVLRLVSPLLLCLTLNGCRQKAPTARNGEPASPAAASAAVDPGTVGELRGVVHFAGKAPERVMIDMAMDPACALHGGENLSEPYVIDKGKLANVYVYLKNAPSSKAAKGAPAVVLDQKGCRFVPHVIAVQQGETVEFRNSDPTMHNIHTTPVNPGNKTVDVSQGPFGKPETQHFETPEAMLPVRCNNHPWMNAFLNVAPSPYFAVSAADGTFTIRDVPAGTYTLAAVHEKLGEQDVQITVPARGTATADVTYKAHESR